MNHRSESGGLGALSHSRHIGNVTFARIRCETPVAASLVTSHGSQAKTPDPFSFFRTHSRETGNAMPDIIPQYGHGTLQSPTG